MLPFERKEKIKEELLKDYTNINELAQLLEVSEITIRRDLKQLEKEGVIEVFHGGVAKLLDTTRETSISKRQSIYSENKQQIGVFAAKLIEDGDVVFLDSGTTTKAIIPELVKKKDLMIVTNGYLNIEACIQHNLPVTVIGGDLKIETMAFVGPLTNKMLDSYHFDKCFLGANGIDYEFGLSNADPNESMVKEKAIKQSVQTYIVSDHSKFDAKSVFKFAELDEVKIITDDCPERYRSCSTILLME